MTQDNSAAVKDLIHHSGGIRSIWCDAEPWTLPDHGSDRNQLRTESVGFIFTSNWPNIA